MTQKEAKQVISTMLATYPNYKPTNIDLTVSVWSTTLQEYSYEQVGTALKVYITNDTSGFAPTPGQIIEKINQIYSPEQMNEQEAWSFVYKAICNSGYESVEEFAKLPKTAQKAVGSPRQLKLWALDENANMAVIQSNFERSYRAEVAREKEYSKYPQEVKELVDAINENSDKKKLEARQEDLIKSIAESKSGQSLVTEDRKTGISSETRKKLEILKEELKMVK